MANYSDILKGYQSELKGKRDAVTVNLSVLLDNPTSIPEHIDIIVEVDKLVDQLANIQEKIEMVDFVLKFKDSQ